MSVRPNIRERAWKEFLPLVPAIAGTQSSREKNWVPAFAGMSGGSRNVQSNNTPTITI
jgi:hypothetical protein